jgi:hypothetical protein
LVTIKQPTTKNNEKQKMKRSTQKEESVVYLTSHYACERQMLAAKLVASNRVANKNFPPVIDDSECWDEFQTTMWTPENFLHVLSKIPSNCLGQQLSTGDIKLELGIEQKMPIAGYDFIKNQVTLRYINMHPNLRGKGIFSSLLRYLLVKYGAVQIEAVQNKCLFMHLLASDKWKLPSYIFSELPGGDYTTLLWGGHTHGRILTIDELRAIAKVDVRECNDDHERYCKQMAAISLW